MPKITNIGLLIFSIVLCQAAGLLGTVFTMSAIPTWYAELSKPFFSPPNSVFGPVWTVLYLLMGISLYIVLISKHKRKKDAQLLFFTQLGLNTLWSIIFFGLRNPVAAFLEILLLWIAIFYTIKVFHTISKKAALLLYPYLAWVTFASLLNFSIWILNP